MAEEKLNIEEFQLVTPDGEFIRFTARLLEGMESKVDLKDIRVTERGNAFTPRAADECESWI